VRTPAEARIDREALRANFGEARRRAAGRRVIAVVKADAYGHGVLEVTRTLAGAGCDQFAVVTYDEAVSLREAGIEGPILVLGTVGSEAEAEAAVAHDLTAVVHDTAGLERLAKAGGARGVRTPVQVEVDTGMRRMGVAPARALELVLRTAGEAGVRLEGVFTHLARADEADLAPSLEQIAAFRGLLEDVRSMDVDPGQIHVANSAGVLAGAALADALPEANAVRPGLMLYGASPAPHFDVALAPVMTLRARVVCLRNAREGEAVGYGATHRCARATRIATLGLGYADGVPIATSNRGQVSIAGGRHPIVGRVSMDSITVDVGDAPVELGDEAVLFGRSEHAGSLPVEEAAEAAGTLSYELLVRVGGRVARVPRN
jgi:alanine racemase